MFLNGVLAGRLKALCCCPMLVDPIDQFFDVWMDSRTSLDGCYGVLEWLCSRLDAHGEYHTAEVLIMEGDKLLRKEADRRRRSKATAMVVVGGLVGFGIGILSGGRRAA